LILNAPNSFAEYRPPLRILHVVRDLIHRPDSPGFNPEAHRLAGASDRPDFDSYKIHAPTIPNTPG
jgi:hypothetical protein